MNQESNFQPRRNVRLSAREEEVLALVAEGHQNGSAADVLYISKRTVDYHLSTIYLKFGVTNRMQAVRAAYKLGLLPAQGRATERTDASETATQPRSYAFSYE